MSPWPFVVASYAMTVAGTAGLLAWSWVAMRRAEAEADAVKRKR